MCRVRIVEKKKHLWRNQSSPWVKQCLTVSEQLEIEIWKKTASESKKETERFFSASSEHFSWQYGIIGVRRMKTKLTRGGIVCAQTCN